MPAVVIAAWGVGYAVSLTVLLQTPAGPAAACGSGPDRLWGLVPLAVSLIGALGAAYITARTPRRRAGRR